MRISDWSSDVCSSDLAWRWYHDVPGEGRCPIIDTWWQTETGAAMIAPLPGATDLKTGSATKPLFGVEPQIVDAEGNVLEGPCEGKIGRASCRERVCQYV